MELKGILLMIAIILTLTGCSKVNRQEQLNASEEITISLNNPMDSTEKQFKILHIMSYHSPWEWTDRQFAGFQAAMNGVAVQYEVFQMDAKNKSSNKSKEAMGEEAREIIASLKPDLVYVSDDEAVEYVVTKYLDTEIPFVFSAVNKSPESYGIVGKQNVSGVLETEHFVGSVELFKEMVPNAIKIAVVFDDSPIWGPVRERMEDQTLMFPEMEFMFLDPITTYSQYQAMITEYSSKVDGLCLVGIFNFKDEAGNNVPYDQVLQWTQENSKIPDFSFWIDRVYHGTLASMSVSGYEQGYAAGRIARGILVDGKSPSQFPMEATTKGEPAINLKRAKVLGILVDSELLLSAKICTTYKWEE